MGKHASNTAPEELLSLLGTDRDFLDYHCQQTTRLTVREYLSRFLRSSMDEVRLLRATELTDQLLSLTDFREAEYLREGVMKREVTGNITYRTQRDHTAHTLYNYLLGWYLILSCSKLRKALKIEIDKRRPRSGKGFDFEFFGDVWQLASLLHDIGYIFEGSLSAIGNETQSEQVEIGVRIVKDYFENRLWALSGFSSVHERKLLLDEIRVQAPNFPLGLSLASVSDQLRNLGEMDSLTALLWEELVSEGKDTRWLDRMGIAGLPRDAFDIWKAHFDYYAQPRVARRIMAVRQIFEDMQFKGPTGWASRMLDHGVCSGLLLLQISTYYFKLAAAAHAAEPTDPMITRVVKRFSEGNDALGYDAQRWWSLVCYGSCATAMHNIHQLDAKYRKLFGLKRLRLKEEPLTYLGILVDCLQEWDRYAVFPNMQGLPIQGSSVTMRAEQGKVVLTFARKASARKVRKNLNDSLVGWSDFVSVGPS